VNESWYLRKPDGAVYGPVALDVLCAWAADGRVAPDDQISPDQTQWQPAPTLAALEMDWVVQLANGDLLGPVHLLALRDAWQADLITPRTPVVRRRTGQSHDLADTLVSALILQDERQRARLADLAARVEQVEAERADAHSAAAAAQSERDTLRTDLRGLQQTLAAHAARIQELEAAPPRPAPAPGPAATPAEEPTAPAPAPNTDWRAQQAARYEAERDAQRWKRLYESDAAAHLRHQQEAEAAQRTLRTDLLAAQRELESLRTRVRAADATPPQTAVASATPGNLDAASLADMVRRLTRNYHAATEQAERCAEELEQARARLAELESGRADQEAAARLAAQAAELATVRSQLAEMEETHRGVLKEFRELHDRHLRLVQARDAGKT
jgi:predicted  nucleic acid-binding Zn-ribbon protein